MRPCRPPSTAGAAALWLVWGLASLAASAALAAALVLDRASETSWRASLRTFFLPGRTSHGHYQIEIACESCHVRLFGGKEALQEACVKCHGAELKEARDSHPRSKFTDPRNAERAARLDATLCVTCHTEHRPGITGRAGLTLPADYCVICHADVGADRPTHANLTFDTCASAGCHNFHDNRALYEDFLVRHAQQPALLPKRALPERDFARIVEELSSYPVERFPLRAARSPDHGPALPATTPELQRDWLETAHAKAGVNCSGCHAPPPAKGTKDTNGTGAGTSSPWIERPSHEVCATCHADETRGYLAGKHGMRAAAGLAPMRPAWARAEMKPDRAHESLGCTSCHRAHRFDTSFAAAGACLSCHDDSHSRAWEKSPHAALWRREQAGESPRGSGVTCASCHMPRIEARTDDVRRILVQHNQNDVLRPAEKMARPVCLACHGLPFSLDALADPALVNGNFNGRPAHRVPSVDMALDAERRANESRRKAQTPGS